MLIIIPGMRFFDWVQKIMNEECKKRHVACEFKAKRRPATENEKRRRTRRGSPYWGVQSAS